MECFNFYAHWMAIFSRLSVGFQLLHRHRDLSQSKAAASEEQSGWIFVHEETLSHSGLCCPPLSTVDCCETADQGFLVLCNHDHGFFAMWKSNLYKIINGHSQRWGLFFPCAEVGTKKITENTQGQRGSKVTAVKAQSKYLYVEKYHSSAKWVCFQLYLKSLSRDTISVSVHTHRPRKWWRRLWESRSCYSIALCWGSARGPHCSIHSLRNGVRDEWFPSHKILHVYHREFFKPFALLSSWFLVSWLPSNCNSLEALP